MRPNVDLMRFEHVLPALTVIPLHRHACPDRESIPEHCIIFGVDLDAH